MRALPLALLAGLALASGSCRGNPVSTDDVDRVAVERVPQGVRLTNETDRGVAYAVWNRGWLALFAPCADPGPECVRLAPGASVTVPEEEVGGYAPGTREVVVRWWHVVPDGAGGYRAAEVREATVAL